MKTRIADWFWLTLAMLISVACGAIYLTRGWIPGDDGALAQSALRVLQGQLPHRDFTEVYTGGLSFYHALAFRVFGVKLVALRYAVFAVFIPWLAAVYTVARRFASPIGAMGITVLCATWSLPVFPVAMPSWYNLFLATFGAAAILRYVVGEEQRWLFLAGFFGGLSIAVKIIGLYYVAAVLLWFIYREQDVTPEAHQPPPKRRYTYSLFVSAGLIGFLLLMSRLTRAQPGTADFFHFFLPGAALTGLLLYREWRLPHASDRERFAILFRMVIPFLAGVSLPVLGIAWPYWRTASLPALVAGVFVRGPATASALAIQEPLGIGYALFAGPIVAILAFATLSKGGAISSLHRVLIAASMALILVCVHIWYFAGIFIWLSAASLTPLVVFAGMLLLARKTHSTDESSRLRDQSLFLMLALAAICSLVQFPYPAPIYFHYAAPLVILAVVALVSTRRQPFSFLLGATVALYALFAVIFLASPNFYRRSSQSAMEPLRALSVPRGKGLWVHHPENFAELVRVVDEHAGNGPILAFPECADVYFLSERVGESRNDISPTPAEIRAILKDDRVRVVVVKMGLVFPESVPTPELLREISARFPNSQRVGEYFVHWR